MKGEGRKGLEKLDYKFLIDQINVIIASFLTFILLWLVQKIKQHSISAPQMMIIFLDERFWLISVLSHTFPYVQEYRNAINSYNVCSLEVCVIPHCQITVMWGQSMSLLKTVSYYSSILVKCSTIFLIVTASKMSFLSALLFSICFN